MESHTAVMLDPKNLYDCFLGELFKEMTVDYERATSEERLDEVRVSNTEHVSVQCSLLWCTTMFEIIFPKKHLQKNVLHKPKACVKL